MTGTQPEQCDAAAEHERPHGHQIEPEQVEVQRVPLQQDAVQQQRQHEPHRPDDDIGLPVVDGQFGAFTPGHADGREDGRHRNHPYIAAQAAAAGGLDEAAAATRGTRKR